MAEWEEEWSVHMEYEDEWMVNTERFLRHFRGNHLFVLMPDNNSASPWHKADGLADAMPSILAKQKVGWGVFHVVNELDQTLDPGRKRTAKMWVGSRALFMDDDVRRAKGDYKRGKGKDAWPLEPSLVVESSPGKFHYYWLIDQCSVDWMSDDRHAWQRMQLGICEKYGGDKQARDLARYLRLPGFAHMKGWKEGGCVDDMWQVRWRGAGKRYKWADLRKAFPEAKGEGLRDSYGSEVGAVGTAKSLEQMELEIINGDDFHGNLRNLSFQMIKDGMSVRLATMAMEGLMMKTPSALQDDRWRKRYDDIKRTVEGAKLLVDNGKGPDDDPDFGSITAEDMAEIHNNITLDEQLVKTGVFGDIPWPPDALGRLAQDAYDMAIYPYREVAVVSAIGLVAGIGGRRYNINGLGLNVYLTLIMETGMGKDSIRKFISKTLRGLNETGQASSFLGAARYTGPKAIARHMFEARCKIAVFTEAGLLLRTTAGDQAGLGRYLLSIYSMSGSGDVTDTEIYSKEDDDIEEMGSPCLSIINEATPITLLQAFEEKNSMEIGDIPRQTIIRVDRDKPMPNFNPLESVGDEHNLRLMTLLKFAQETQSLPDPAAVNMVMEPEAYEAQIEYVKSVLKRQNDLRGSTDPLDERKRLMLTRAHAKALKTSGISGRYNTGKAIVRKADWDWAEALTEYELRNVDNFFKAKGIDGVMDVVRKVVAPKIWRLVKGTVKVATDGQDATTPRERELGHFKRNGLKKMLQSNKVIDDMGDKQGYSGSKLGNGLEKVLEYMEKECLIETVSKRPLAYKITKGFKNIMGDK